MGKTYRNFNEIKQKQEQEQIETENRIVKQMVMKMTPNDIDYKKSTNGYIIATRMFPVEEKIKPELHNTFTKDCLLNKEWDDFFGDTKYTYEAFFEWVCPFGLHLIVTLGLKPIKEVTK